MERNVLKTLGRQPLAALLIAVAFGLRAPPIRSQEEPAAQPAVTYDQVRPLFVKRCVTCHDRNRNKGDLDLSTLEGIKAGGVSGPAVVAGKPDESLIYSLSAHLETPKMPPNNPKIPQREIDLIYRWIEGGLVERERAVAKSVPALAVRPAAPTPAVPPQPGAVNTVGVAIDPLRRPTPITALAASPKAPLVAVSGRKQVVLFRWTDRVPLTAFPFPEGEVFALRFSRDGTLLVAGGGVGGLSGKVVGFEVATGKRLFEVGDEPDVVLALDISPDQKLVALGGPGRSVKVFRTADGILTATLRKHTDWILSLAFSPEGLLLASGDRFGGLQVWEARSGNEFQTLRGHVGPVHGLGWSADSERLLSAGQDGSLRFWDMHDGSQSARWEGGVGGILSVECDSAGRVICGGRDHKIAVWENPESRLRQMSTADEVVKLGLSHDTSHLIAGDAAGNVTVFALENGGLAGTLALPLGPAAISTAAAHTPQTGPGPQRAPQLSTELAVAEAEARLATAELVNVREASALAEAAVKAAEESLKRLRESTSKLSAVVTTWEAAAKRAAERAAELRAKAEAVGTNAASGPSGLRAEQQRIQRQLKEKRSLLESAAEVTARIVRAAEQSPHDGGLAAAAKLATELQGRLSRDVEETTAELRHVEKSLREFDDSSAARTGK